MSDLGKYLLAAGSVTSGPAPKRTIKDKIIFLMKRLFN